jgi:hypothetical protein
MKQYASSLDMAAKNVPWLVLAICVFVVWRAYPVTHTFTSTAVLCPAILIGGCLVFTFIFKTKALAIDNDSIIIERMPNNVVINFSDIKSVKKEEEMTFAIRTFGNGGVFGYTGMFYKKGIGSMRWYATQRKNYILIEKINGRKVVITPDEPDAFISDIAARRPALVA